MSSKIRSLFVSRLDFGLRTGGVQMQVDRTRAALEARGVEVILCDPWHDSMKGVDICHLFTTAPDLFSYAQVARQKNIPFVITPVLNSSEPAWLIKFKAKLLSQLPGVYTQLRLSKQILARADAVLPLTRGESEFLQEVFNVPVKKMQIVPNGVESRFGQAKPDLFLQKFGFKPDVLFVGRIDRNKNVLSLIEALEGSGLMLAVIGYPYADEPHVFEAFKRKLGNKVVYLGSMQNTDPLLASAYAASKVFCLPSFKEVMPLTVLEALSAGCRLVLTTRSSMKGFLKNDVFYVQPHKPAHIRKAIFAAYHSQPPYLSRERVLNECTWEMVAAEIFQVYSRLLEA